MFLLYHRGKKAEITSNRLEASCDGAVDTEEKQSLSPSLMFFIFLNMNTSILQNLSIYSTFALSCSL